MEIVIKYVPKSCVYDEANERYYQSTAIDEYSRQRYLEGFADNSSHLAAVFLLHALEYFKYPTKSVQTDNGFEFTKTYTRDKHKNVEQSLTLFQEILFLKGIQHKQIWSFTQRNNGMVAGIAKTEKAFTANIVSIT